MNHDPFAPVWVHFVLNIGYMYMYLKLKADERNRSQKSGVCPRTKFEIRRKELPYSIVIYPFSLDILSLKKNKID